MIDDIQGIVIDLREMAPKRHSFIPNVPHILEVAADVIEDQEDRIAELRKTLQNVRDSVWRMNLTDRVTAILRDIDSVLKP